jgi:decaprenylphospho-beta-D-erythro-pentofuranosid-2-ulose 2-reductase
MATGDGLIVGLSSKGSKMRVVIFGACSAIAQATARIWAGEGAQMVLVDRDAARLEATKRDLEVRGGVCAGVLTADLSDSSGHERLLLEINAKLPDCDTVFIAWGTLGDQKAAERDFAVAATELQINFLSVVSILTRVANYFEQRKSGTIVVISSPAGDRGRQSNYVYGSAKGGLSVFLSGLRNRLYPAGVRVLTVKPGFVDTPMTASFKKGLLWVKPEVIARGIAKGVKRGASQIYVPWFWWPIMTIIKHVPEEIFKRLRL